MNEQIQQVIEKISQAVQESPETVEAAIQNGGEEGFKQVVTSLLKGDVKSAKAMIQKLAGARKAAHGAKLNYFRKLKNQCPEGEELYYYKKGGSVGCGCKKKEDGGEIITAKEGSAVEKFKKGQFGLRTNELVKNHQDKKKEEEKKKKANTWGASTKYIAKPKNADPKKMPLDNAVPNEDIPSHDKKANRKKCGGKVEKDCNGAVAKFKAKCGSKLKKHQLGGSLNGIPFMQAGTPKGGIEKSDNTRVQRIPNNGEGVYEQIPVNGWNFIPIVGTLKEAKMLDQGDPNASVTRLGISLAGDLAGAGMIGSVAKAAGRVNGIQKALRARGYLQFTKDGSLWFRLPKKIIRGYGDKLHTYEIPNIYGGSSFKTIPTVDYTPAVMAPLVLTLRVPAEAPFFNYSR